MSDGSGSRRVSGSALGILVTLSSAIIFGLWPPCVRAVYADGANASFALVTTVMVRTLSLWLFCVLTRRPLFETRSDRRLAVKGGFFQAVGMIGIIASLNYVPGPVALTILFTHTIMLLFYLAYKGERKLDALSIATTLAALAGLTFVVGLWNAAGPVNAMGVGLAFMSALATVNRLYVFGQMTKTKHPAVTGAETFIVAAAFVILAALVRTPQLPATLAGWGWIALGSLALAVGTFGMFYGIAMIGSFRFSLVLKTEPIFTALFSALLIGETLDAGQYFGILVVIGSLAVYQYMDYKHGKRPT